MVERDETGPSRRTLLATIGTYAGAGLAGCVGGDGDGTGDDGESTGADRTTGRDGASGDGAGGEDDTGTAGTGDGSGADGGDDDGSAGDGEGEADGSSDDTDGEDGGSSGDGEGEADGSSDDGDDSATDGNENSTSETTPATVDEGGPPGEDGWELTFESTFEDGSRDRNVWSLGSGYGLSCPGAGLECWQEDHVWVDGATNRLVIETTDEPSGDREYTSASISTRGAFEQEFGYFEAKSRPPSQPGSQAAFWAWWNPDDWTYRREIDVYEIFGEDSTTAVHSVHTNCEHQESGTGPTEWKGGESTLSTPADDAFHVWGVEWTPESVGFYVDGEERLRVEGQVISDCFAGEPLWLLLSTGVNDDHGDPAAADYPYTHEIEWVRAWQYGDWE